MTQKITGKQKIVEGFDLDKFVGGADQENTTPPVTPKSPPEAQKPSQTTRAPKKRVKRSTGHSRGKQELLTERVQIKLTQLEMQTLQDKTGLVPISVFVRKFLKDNGLI